MPRTATAASLLLACALAGQEYRPYVAPATDEARDAMPGFRLAPGLRVSLVAAEPDLANPVAFTIDGHGRFFVVETFRINDGVFDTRNHMYWKDDDLACLTVADRIALHEKHMKGELDKYRVEHERVRLLLDRDRDGVVDESLVFADGFNRLEDGIAAGVLAVGRDVWFTNIPKLWRLRDKDGDGRADEREAVHDGFGVHVSLIGHDLHGLTVGPDRRLYFSIGDRGLHVETPEGTLAYPHEGAVLRCELDGSKLEIWHRGLRNPQELAFDDHGNLFTGDNNSDGGDRARWVYVARHGDSGWRIGYQWLSDRGAWNREKMWVPPYPGQPAWIVPPVANIADGPSGLAYDPGIGLPERLRGHFFLCDFRAVPAISGVHALKFTTKGAGFELERRERLIWNVVATDVAFAPNGSLCVLDWVGGWTKTGKGRIYRIDTASTAMDLRRGEVARLLGEDLTRRSRSQLLALLRHADRRVRQAAQFALVDQNARATLALAAEDPEFHLARLHGIWGLGILGRRDPAALEPLTGLLRDGDAEVRAQAARVLGEARVAAALPGLIAGTADPNSRVRYQCCLALGALGEAAAENGTTALLEVLEHDAGRDPWLRHAAVAGLAGLGDREAVLAAAEHASTAVRMGVLLVLRMWEHPAVAGFLDDADELLRAEAARAIHDVPIPEAMPALAATIDAETGRGPAALTTPGAYAFAIAWRALNAHRFVGTADSGKALLRYACNPDNPMPMRIEALEILGEWPAPHGQDRVGGNWRPVEHPDPQPVLAAFGEALPGVLDSREERVAAAAAAAAGRLRLPNADAALAEVIARRERDPETRVAALRALAAMDSARLEDCVSAIGAGDPIEVRKTAVRLFGKRDPAVAIPLLATILENGEIGERQSALSALDGFRQGDAPHPAAAALCTEWLRRLRSGDVPPPLQLELLETADRLASHPDVARELEAYRQGLPAGDPLAAHRPSLEGGDRRAGRRIFFEHEAARCMRCHTVGGRGGNAGPVLDGIGSLRSREELLQSLVAPSAVIAEGYATAVLHLHNGDVVSGIVVKDQDGVVEIMDLDGEITTVPQGRIARRAGSEQSGMPPMADVLTPRELRDVIAFLASLEQR